ncbi:hypothetical protein ACA910_001686 [Epithemia clementina (nom. ined.)]
MSPNKNFRITLDQLQAVRRRQRLSGNNHPCSKQIERVLAGLKATNGMIGPIYKYVKDMEECICYYRYLKTKKHGKATPMFYLSKYLDQQKFKRK